MIHFMYESHRQGGVQHIHPHLNFAAEYQELKHHDGPSQLFNLVFVSLYV